MFVDCIWDEKSLQAVLVAGGACTLEQKIERVASIISWRKLALTFQNIDKSEYWHDSFYCNGNIIQSMNLLT